MKTRFGGEPVFVCQNLNGILQKPVQTVKPFIYKDLTMSLQALEGQRFIRKTQLAPNEYRRNFQQIDREVISVVTSAEADKITPLMGKIYLRLVNAPGMYWEREGVLRIEAEVRDGKLLKAWTVLCELTGVASATARKAIVWMHEQGIIGYFSGKNGVGLRIFFNRAVSSIGARQTPSNKKILAFPPASSKASPASTNETAFNDSFAVLEVSDTNIYSVAPKNGADNGQVDKSSSEPTPPEPSEHSTAAAGRRENPLNTASPKTGDGFALDDVVARLRAELEPAIHAAARQAAAREHERTREWLETRGLPKAARVAQHEAYNVLRKHGLVNENRRHAGTQGEVGHSEFVALAPHRLVAEEIVEMAEACVAMLETHGQTVERTLAEMSVQAGGFLSAEDASKVREKADSLLAVGNGREGK